MCNFLMLVVSDPAKEGALLDLLILNKEGQVSDVMFGSHPGHKNQKMIRSSSKRVTLDFLRGDFSLFRRLAGRVPCEAVLKHKRRV